jgi:hypothetical protein
LEQVELFDDFVDPRGVPVGGMTFAIFKICEYFYIKYQRAVVIHSSPLVIGIVVHVQ